MHNMNSFTSGDVISFKLWEGNTEYIGTIKGISTTTVELDNIVMVRSEYVDGIISETNAPFYAFKKVLFTGEALSHALNTKEMIFVSLTTERVRQLYISYVENGDRIGRFIGS